MNPPLVNRYLSGRPSAWWICFLGAAVAIFTFAVVVLFSVIEADELLRLSPTELATDAVTQIGGGVIVAGVAFLPYLVLYLAASRTRFGRGVLLVALLCFVLDLSLRVDSIFGGRSSTEGVAILTLPVLLTVVAAAFWGVLEIANRFSAQHD